MRNLKRVLSLALASVMLMGMMVVGSSAAANANDFKDASSIDNKEAVSIAAGLGLFVGDDNGNFNPKATITRAEAAVIICKMLYGSDVNPANFTGVTKFTDVPAWAEGWVNLAYANKIVVGVSETEYAPNKTLNTVEFSTMLLKALGYYVGADNAELALDWEMTITAKATSVGIYGDLELGMRDDLSRENVAELAFNALFARTVAYDEYRGAYVKAIDDDALAIGEVAAEETLAYNTFGLYSVEGVVVKNAAVEKDSDTVLVLDEDCMIAGEAYVAGEEYPFDVETGLDMIGHAATIYYTVEKKTPVVYAVADTAALAVKTVMTNDALKTVAKDNGFASKIDEVEVIKNYNMDVAADAEKNDIIVMIANEGDMKLDYVIVLEQTLDYVADVDVNDDDEDEIITTYEATVDYADTENTVIGEIVKGDYIIVTEVSDELSIIEKAETEVAYINKITRKNDVTTKMYDADKAYVGESSVTTELADVTLFADVEIKGDYVLVFDCMGRLIAVEAIEEETSTNAAYAAQFGYVTDHASKLNDKYVLTVHVYFADGTDEICELKLAGIAADYKGELDEEADFENAADELNAMIGLYDITVSDGVATVKVLETEMTDEIEQVKKGITWMGEADKRIYANSKTTFWMVNGTYGKSSFKVATIDGIANVPTVYEIGKDAKAEIAEAYASLNAKETYYLVSDMLIKGYEAETELADTVYYYNGEHTIVSRNNVKGEKIVTLTYTVYDITTGEATTLSYKFDTTDAAKDAADIETGFYTEGKDNLAAHTCADADKVQHVVSTFVDYEDMGDHLTLYTEAHDDAYGKIVDDTTVFVDLTSNKMDEVQDLAGKKILSAEIAYVFAGKDEIVDVIFVLDVEKK